MSKVLRVPKLDLPAVLAQQNPQIDLRLEAYEASTRNFFKAVSNYTQRAVTEITNRKNAFAAEKKKVAEKTTQIETETNQSKLREIELIAGASNISHPPNSYSLGLRLSTVLDKEQEEKKESEASVAAFRRQLASVKEKCASLDVEIEQHRIIAANLMRGMFPYFCIPHGPLPRRLTRYMFGRTEARTVDPHGARVPHAT